MTNPASPGSPASRTPLPLKSLYLVPETAASLAAGATDEGPTTTPLSSVRDSRASACTGNRRERAARAAAVSDGRGNIGTPPGGARLRDLVSRGGSLQRCGKTAP